jgi:acyl carrier protein
MKDIDKEIKSLVSKIIKIQEEKIDPNANLFYDLGVDSLLGVEILASLDKKYNLDVPEEKLRSISSLNDIISLTKELIEKKKSK